MMGRPYRVLVVDDDPDVCELLRREIADLGYEVDTAASAQSAIEAMDRMHHPIVVADICLPGMDGVTLTRRFKESNPESEVVLITGHATVETAAAAVRLGACDYLLKPLADLAELRASVERAVARLDRSAVATSSESDAAQWKRQLFGLLDLLPLAVFLIDGSGEFRGGNRLAEKVLHGGWGVRLDEARRLSYVDPKERDRWSTLLESARRMPQSASPQFVGGMRVACKGLPAGALPLAILKMGSDLAFGSAPADGLLVALPAPDLGAGETVRLLTELYGLTPAEARLAALTLQGSSIEEAARELQIAEATARTHLRRIFAKTKTSRQGELISVLLAGPVLLGSAAGVR